MKNEIPGQPNINIVSSGSLLTGTFKSKSDLRISGSVEGEVHAESKCIVSESGIVKGDLVTKEADIAGTIQGELRVANRLILRASAKITGDIQTKTLMVEEGAHIDGSFKMGGTTTSDAAAAAGNNKGTWKKEPEKKNT